VFDTISLPTLAAVGQLIGVLLGSYGLLRESFADLAHERPYGEGRFGEGTFGGGPSRPVRCLVEVGIRLRLLPRDRQLSLTDRKRNAAFAIAVLIVLIFSMLVELSVAFATRP